jgi:hypothetical protein
MHTNINTQVCVCINTKYKHKKNTHMHIKAYMHTCMHKYMHAHTHTHAHVLAMHTHAHAHTYINAHTLSTLSVRSCARFARCHKGYQGRRPFGIESAFQGVCGFGWTGGFRGKVGAPVYVPSYMCSLSVHVYVWY